MRRSCMTRQARRGLTSLPPLWQPTGQLRGAAVSTHTQLIALRQVNDACRRPCSPQTASVLCSYLCRGQPVSLWRGESHLPSLLSANTPMAVAELWTVTADHQLDLHFYQMQHGPKLASSTSPQKPPTTYMWVNDFRPHRDSLFWVATYTRELLIGEYIRQSQTVSVPAICFFKMTHGMSPAARLTD